MTPSIVRFSYLESHSTAEFSSSQNAWSSDVRMCPYLEHCVCTLLDGICPCVEVLALTCLRAFFSSATGAKSFVVRSFPLRGSHSAVKMCLLSEPLSVLLIGCAPTGTSKPMGSPHLNPRANEPPAVFLYRVPLISWRWDVPRLERHLRWRDTPRMRGQLSFALTLEVLDCQSGRGS